MPTLVALAGWEWGTTAGLASGNANARLVSATAGTLGTDVQIAGAAARSGGYGLRISYPAASSTARNVQFASDIIGSGGVVVWGCWLRVSAAPAATVNLFSVTSSPGGDFVGRFDLNTSGQIVIATANGSLQTGPALTAGIWHWISARLDVSTAAFELRASVDGGADTVATDTQTGVSITRLVLGELGAVNADLDVDYDDLVVSATLGDYPLGEHEVVALIPDTGGTTAEIGTVDATARFTDNGGTLEATHNSADILAAISERPPTIGASASGVYQRTTGAGNAVGVPMTSYGLTGTQTVSGVRVLVCGWAASATANNVGLRAHNGSAETTLFAAADPNFDASTTTPAWLCRMYVGVTDQATLDALRVRFGYSTDISPQPGAHAIYAEVAIAGQASVAAPEVTTSIPLSLAVTGTTTAEHEVTVAIPLGLAVTAQSQATHDVTAAVPLGLELAATADAPVVPLAEVTASVPLAVDVTAAARATHQVSADVPLTTALAGTTDAPPVADAEVTASIPLGLTVAATTAAEHTVTAGVPLALAVTATVDAPEIVVPGTVTAQVPLTLAVTPTGATHHRGSAAVPLILTLPAVTAAARAVTAAVALALQIAAASQADDPLQPGTATEVPPQTPTAASAPAQTPLVAAAISRVPSSTAVAPLIPTAGGVT